MSILSLEFALAFAVFFVVYWGCRRHPQLQNILLVVASVALLASLSIQFVINLLLVWAVTQVALTVMQYTDDVLVRRFALASTIFIIVAQLGFYKYSNFLIEEANLAGLSILPLDIILPLGISFYSFQAISYVVDAYRKQVTPMPAWINLGYLSMFLTVTAGPIFLAKDAKPYWQPPEPRKLLLPYLAISLIGIALVKKIVLASWLATSWVDPIFANPLQYPAIEVWVGVYAYALQLFFDFSGYTDLVIALGLLLGFRLPQNFNAPYLAVNIREFWQRWHITLSHWIRDYLYIPLGGNRQSWLRTQINLLLAFVISGVWHGAGWNFFVWGLIHGVALVWLNVMTKFGWQDKISRLSPAIGIVITFHYVCFGWVFFRSPTWAQSMEVLSQLTRVFAPSEWVYVTPNVLMVLAVMGASWILYPRCLNLPQIGARWLARMPWYLLPIPIATVVIIIFGLAPAGLPNFIYANF